MAKYNVYMRSIPSVKLGILDVVFDVNADNEKLGSLSLHYKYLYLEQSWVNSFD